MDDPIPDVYSGSNGSLYRGARLLAELATGGKSGLTLGNLVQRTGMPHATAHRTCTLLSELDWITRDADTRKFRLGKELSLLGLAAQQNYSLSSIALPVLEDLSAKTGQTSYLLMRSRNAATCIARVDGQAQVRTFLLDVGDRWLLGQGAAGMALLAALDKVEGDAILAQNKQQLMKWEDDIALRHRLAVARETGIACHSDLFLQGVSGMGKAVLDRAKTPVATISLGYVSLWMKPGEEDSMRHQLVQAVDALSSLME